MSSRFEWERALRQSDMPPTRKAVLMTLSTFANKAGEARPSQEKLAEASGFSVRAVGNHIRAALADGWIVRTRKGRGAGPNMKKAVTSEYLLTIPTVNRHDVPADSTGTNGNDVPADSGGQPAPERVVNRHEVPTFSTRNILPSLPPVENDSGQQVDHAARLRQIQQMIRDRKGQPGPFDDDGIDAEAPALGKLLGQWGQSA